MTAESGLPNRSPWRSDRLSQGLLSRVMIHHQQNRNVEFTVKEGPTAGRVIHETWAELDLDQLSLSGTVADAMEHYLRTRLCAGCLIDCDEPLCPSCYGEAVEGVAEMAERLSQMTVP